jgi:DNA-binding NarL/FixJ family response regulator
MTVQIKAEQTASDTPLPKVSVVDDDADLLTFFKELADSGRFVLLGAYGSAREALADLPQRRPDILFMDLRLPDMTGIECTRRLTTLLRGLKVIVITGHPEPSVLVQAFRAGALGFVVKPCTVEEILAAIRDVLNEGVMLGKTALPYLHRIIRHLSRRDTDWNLTEREEQLIACVFEGMSYKEIASKLKIGQSTVHTHMDHLFAKLGVHSQEELIAKFLQP